ncbi:MAG: hypothetical protein IVW54_21200 [Candidatus Binataceae bacterium]|nr:hypothetical protein [Candidatus Binataceae bacterium]
MCLSCALKYTDGHKRTTADLPRISRETLYRKIEENRIKGASIGAAEEIRMAHASKLGTVR